MASQSVSTPGADQADDGDLLLAQRVRVADLPGVFRKKLVLNPEETGVVTANGSIISQLGGGANSVGWSMLGFGAGKKSVLRVHSRPFTIRLQFFNLITKTYDTVDGAMHVTATVNAPTQFFGAVVRDRESLWTSDVASAIGASVDDFMQVRISQAEAESLREDHATQDQVGEELKGHVSRALEERGLKLESVDFLAFHSPDEGGELLDQIEEVDRLIESGVKPGEEDTKRLLTQLETRGLATPEMAERARLLYDGGTNEGFFGAMRDIASASRRRLQSQAVGRSDHLARKLDDPSAGPVESGPNASEQLLKYAGPTMGVAGFMYKVIPDLYAGWWALGVGVGVGLLFMFGYLGVRAKRLMTLRRSDDIVIRLDRWAKKNSMETDELIRRQMARELSNAVSDVRDAKLAAFRQENREVADSLNEIEDRLDLVRTEVEAAPAASSIVSQDGFPKQRIERMVRFEEEMMRSARNLTIRSQTVKSNLASEDIAELSMGLDNFQRTFSKRLGLLEGFRDL